MKKILLIIIILATNAQANTLECFTTYSRCATKVIGMTDTYNSCAFAVNSLNSQAGSPHRVPYLPSITPVQVFGSNIDCQQHLQACNAYKPYLDDLPQRCVNILQLVN